MSFTKNPSLDSWVDHQRQQTSYRTPLMAAGAYHVDLSGDILVIHANSISFNLALFQENIVIDSVCLACVLVSEQSLMYSLDIYVCACLVLLTL